MTHDVPGANPLNSDSLDAGCWAERKDGSLIHVEDVEDDNVRFELVNKSRTKSSRHSMPLEFFNLLFSGTWDWHDKTAFPVERIAHLATPEVSPLPVDIPKSKARRIIERIQEAINTLLHE
ncbi:hypothetical protein AYO40_01025 [Planctomycetaceae bacterium SCGC AG-212-D15]|nr:hypothetical protein AYO40_01025 [Planctomycetaceae bacterium SCGC AG-212-D15]